MNKNIIWLDDDFHEERYEMLLEDIHEPITKLANITPAITITEFAEILDEQKDTIHGLIIDIMLYRESEDDTFAPLGRQDIEIQAFQAGLQLTKLLQGGFIVDEEDKNNFFETNYSKLPILLLTNEQVIAKKVIGHSGYNDVINANHISLLNKDKEFVKNELKKWIIGL